MSQAGPRVSEDGATRTAAEPPLISERDFQFIAELIYRLAGIKLGTRKRQMVSTRLGRRMRALGISTYRGYIDMLQGPGQTDELPHLVNALTTNVTSFFRGAEHFDHLRATAIPDSLRRIGEGGQDRLRIWSAGCSSGEESYSIAIVLRNALASERPDIDAKVLATDIDTSVLGRAKRGRYRDESLAAVSLWDRQKYFLARSRKSDPWRVADTLRDVISFRQLNLLEPWPMRGKFDAIFCRNVMIYFDNPTKRDLIERCRGHLRPGGWLYLGNSETIVEMAELFERDGPSIYRRPQ